MRLSCLALVVFMSLSSVPVLATDIPVESSIKSAVVYNDRATLTRSATIDIPAGAHNLIFTGLPISLYPDSLRTEGYARASVSFGAVTHKRASHEDYVAPREKALNEQLVILQDQRQSFQIEKQALQAGQKFLQNLGKQAGLRANEDIAEIDLKPESWALAADSISAKLLENMKSSHMIDIKVRDVNDKIQKTRNELNDLRTGQKQSYHVTIPFESDKATTLTVDLSYQLPGVSWQPIYDARLDVKSGKLALIQYGSVWQRTGKDWTDVALTLSTAQPSRGTSLPDLHPHWISLYQQRTKERRRDRLGQAAYSTTMMADADVAMEMDDFAEEMEMKKAAAPQAATFQAAQINTDGFVGEYKITGPATVKSDGTKAKLLIGSFETENTMQRQVKPQYSTDAYLVLKTKLKGDAPILPGQVSLFRDNAYIGKTHLPMLRPGDMEDLAFGIDDNVTVKRRVLKDENSEAGIISKDRVIEKNFSTEIQNLHKDPVEIAVLETVPVSQDKRLRVEILQDKTTADYEMDVNDMRGVTRWTQTLQPEQKSRITLGWKVSWPKDENVSGL